MEQLALIQREGKRCPRCKRYLALEMFKGWSPGRQGQYAYCVPCRRAYMRRYTSRMTPAKKAAIGQRASQRYAIARMLPTVTLHTVGAYRRAVTADPCAYCGERPRTCKWTGRPLGTIDHIEPRSQGGNVEWENETASCWSCNRFKRTKTLLTFMLDIVDREPILL